MTNAAAAAAAAQQTRPSPSASWQAHDADGLWIVRFKKYRMAAEHRAALEAALAGASPPVGPRAWAWVERRNAAMRFPTDFGLVRVAGDAGPIKAALEALPFVKDVHPERRLTRAMLSQEQSGGGGGRQQPQQPLQPAAAWPTGSDQFAPCKARDTGGEHCVQKRPGRLQTRPTFSLEGNVPEGQLGRARAGTDTVEAAEAAAAVRRRALLQDRSDNLATLLGADKLWAAGFRGQKARTPGCCCWRKGGMPLLQVLSLQSFA